jgi:PAS domain S-box-containing protein
MADLTTNQAVYVSPNFEEIWGRPVKSILEDINLFFEAIHPDDRERVRLAHSKQQEKGMDQIYRVVKPNGETRWIKDRGFVVRNESGEAYRIVGVAEDITALHETEERLEATRAQMISNAKFAALGEMASGIAHEINNPLAVIHGLTVHLQELFHGERASPSMVIESLASMEKMCNRIAAIIKGLRTLSRHTEGDPKVFCDLNGIVQETMAMCDAKLRHEDIQLKIGLPSSRVMVPCRSNEISQVLLNLVSNAVDAVNSHSSDRSIFVGVTSSNGLARIVVEDSGPGIDPAQRDRIFHPFFTTKEVCKGTGLGLSISKGIVEAHGGTLFLDTSAKTTRFVVELFKGNS